MALIQILSARLVFCLVRIGSSGFSRSHAHSVHLVLFGNVHVEQDARRFLTRRRGRYQSVPGPLRSARNPFASAPHPWVIASTPFGSHDPKMLITRHDSPQQGTAPGSGGMGPSSRVSTGSRRKLRLRRRSTPAAGSLQPLRQHRGPPTWACATWAVVLIRRGGGEDCHPRR